jgi:hypothetical protein
MENHRTKSFTLAAWRPILATSFPSAVSATVADKQNAEFGKNQKFGERWGGKGQKLRL